MLILLNIFEDLIEDNVAIIFLISNLIIKPM
jgi:hypothetical protein